MALTQHKLKIASLDLKPGEMREVEIEGVSDSKILLANTAGQTTALSSKCTHYGAPLAKGVLTSSGRIVCPWHGACFNAKTGDVENAPALDGLSSFPLKTQDGGVYIEAEAESLKANRKKPNVHCKAAAASEKVVIVGGGSGAEGALEGLRIACFQGSIKVISTENYSPIDRTKLSKALIPDASKLALRDASFYANAGVTFLTETVTSIDFPSKTLTTSSKKKETYNHLILATGGSPRRLPLPGFKDRSNIFVLRTISDVQSILAAAEGGPKNIVVIGSSFIGMEVGTALAGKDHKVTIIGMESEPLERVLGKEVGATIRKGLEKKYSNLHFSMSASIEGAQASKSNPDAVSAITTKGNDVSDCDFVVLGVGVAPATEYLKESTGAPALQPDGSLETDTSFAVKGLESVYAIGDIASFPYHGPGGNGKLVRIEHWNVAQNAGRIAARHIAGKIDKDEVQPIPIFWSALGAQLRYCGNTPNGWDQLEVVGDLEGGSWAAVYAKGEEVVALATMGKDPWMSKSSELMRAGKMPKLADIKNGVDVLTIEV
ncbi:MAG: hypothetical protein M1814_006842 [Vezdaea aestivalis]|nr:MAG: hypothetical protein M1814_006842 [Vezdaea aestivalis]